MLSLLRWLVPIAIGVGVSERLIRLVESRPSDDGLRALLSETRRRGGLSGITSDTIMSERDDPSLVVIPDTWPHNAWQDWQRIVAGRLEYAKTPHALAWPIVQAYCDGGELKMRYVEAFERSSPTEWPIASIDPQFSWSDRIVLAQHMIEAIRNDAGHELEWGRVHCAGLQREQGDLAFDRWLLAINEINRAYGIEGVLQRQIAANAGLALPKARFAGFDAGGPLPVYFRSEPESARDERTIRIYLQQPSRDQDGRIVVTTEHPWETPREWHVSDVEVDRVPWASLYDLAAVLSRPQVQGRVLQALADGLDESQDLHGVYGSLADVFGEPHPDSEWLYLAQRASPPSLDAWSDDDGRPEIPDLSSWAYLIAEETGRLPDCVVLASALAYETVAGELELFSAAEQRDWSSSQAKRWCEQMDETLDFVDEMGLYRWDELTHIMSAPGMPINALNQSPRTLVAQRLLEQRRANRGDYDDRIFATDGENAVAVGTLPSHTIEWVPLDDVAPGVWGTLEMAFGASRLPLRSYLSMAERDHFDAYTVVDQRSTSPIVAKGGDGRLEQLVEWHEDLFVLAHDAHDALVVNAEPPARPRLVRLEDAIQPGTELP